MVWARMLAYITGTVDQELLLERKRLCDCPQKHVIRVPWNIMSRTHGFNLRHATDLSDGSDRRQEMFSSPAETKESRDVRFRVDDWISTSKRALIVGVAGSGKTTLLRYILLDLLSP